MAVFGLYKPRLQRLIYDATGDPAAYQEIYEIILKKHDAPAAALDVAIDDIKKRWKKKDGALRKTRAQNSAETLSSSLSALSPTGISNNMPSETLKCIGILKVLHGIVLSFPFEMAQVLEEKTNGGKLLKLVHSQFIPLDIRLVLVTLASRWYVCLSANPQAQKNLAVIVDSFFSDTGLLPTVSFLPKTPSKVRRAVGVEYPLVDRSRPMATYMYLPRSRMQTAVETGSARLAATDPLDAANGRKEQDTHDNIQRQSFQISRPFLPREQYQQQHQNQQLERRRSLQNNTPLQVIQQRHKYRFEHIPLQQTSQPNETDSADAGEKPKVTVEQLSRMTTCAQELCSISNMIIDNLVALAIDDDPRTNPVIQDMMSNMSHMHTVVANYISMLSAEHVTETRKLKQAIDESKRCQWVYNDTAHTFAVWAETKDQYKKDGAATGTKSAGFADVSSSSASGSKYAGNASSSNGVMMLDNLSQSFGPKPATENNAEKIPTTVQRMSTKVRGKMADTSISSDKEDN